MSAQKHSSMSCFPFWDAHSSGQRRSEAGEQCWACRGSTDPAQSEPGRAIAQPRQRQRKPQGSQKLDNPAKPCQVIPDPCTTFLDSTHRLVKAFSLAFTSTRMWRLCSLIHQQPKSSQLFSIKVQRENINHWENGLLVPWSWNSSTFVHLSCSQVVGQSCCVQLPSPSAVPGWWELPCSGTALEGTTIHTEAGGTGTLHGKLSHSQSCGDKHNHSSSPHCCSRTTCTEQSPQQGLRADLNPRTAHSAHTPPGHRQDSATSRYSPPRVLSGSGSVFAQELLFLMCQRSRPAWEEFQDYGYWCQMQSFMKLKCIPKSSFWKEKGI